jgi:hypothetical protein
MMMRRLSFLRKALAVMAVAALAAGPNLAAADTTFPETGFSMWGPFEQYWKAQGGLAQFGMARTSVYPAGQGYDAQWFERALFTYTPANPDPYKVQLQLVGSMVTANRRGEGPFQRAPAALSGQYFEATGHNLMGKFLEYWRSTGGLPIYGYPISEQFTERSKSDGKEYVVQYFERNRLELHPELAGTAYEVQLGLLGSELLDAQGGPSAFANKGAPGYYPPPSGVHNVYPKEGHAADYSWVAGQVAFTRIQGGCVFVRENGESFAPEGMGWDSTKLKQGDYVVILGHIAGPDEPHQICPGGRPYIVERTVLNP